MLIRPLALVLILTAPLGCDNPKTPGIAVSGRVTLRGKPLQEGMISFQADFFKGGRSASARIADGRYAIGASDGPFEGTYEVLIVGFRAEPGANGGKFVTSDEVPERYNKNSELSVTFPKGNAPVELMFDLE